MRLLLVGGGPAGATAAMQADADHLAEGGVIL